MTLAVKNDSFAAITNALLNEVQTGRCNGGRMPVTNNRLPVVAILLLLASPVFAGPQESKGLLASANGTGTLKIGQEQFKINAVVVKCLEDGSVEINLITEI